MHNDRHQHADHDNLHPSLRPAEPDHPMMVEGGVIDGDTALMFRCMIEEYLLNGYSIDTIRDMCIQPNYQAFYAAFQSLGSEKGELILSQTAARIGQHRVRFIESSNNAQQATLTVNATTTIQPNQERQPHA